jgi:hypothetical protein
MELSLPLFLIGVILAAFAIVGAIRVAPFDNGASYRVGLYSVLSWLAMTASAFTSFLGL